MAQSPKYASGKYAWAMCDVCGVRCKYSDLKRVTVRGRWTGLLVCPTDWDPDHPQNFLSRYIRVDPQALQHPRPDTGLADSRILLPNNNWLNGPPARTFRRDPPDLSRIRRIT